MRCDTVTKYYSLPLPTSTALRPLKTKEEIIILESSSFVYKIKLKKTEIFFTNLVLWEVFSTETNEWRKIDFNSLFRNYEFYFFYTKTVLIEKCKKRK